MRTKPSDRCKKAIDRALNEEGLDYTLEVFEAPDFVQIVGSIGGDIVTYRFYDSGLVVEK